MVTLENFKKLMKTCKNNYYLKLESWKMRILHNANVWVSFEKENCIRQIWLIERIRSVQVWKYKKYTIWIFLVAEIGKKV